MSLSTTLWFLLTSLFLGVPGIYYLYMKHIGSQPWSFRISKSYSPRITILVPTYNEGHIIRLKLENLYRVKYDRHQTEIILVDSASTDDTLKEANEFAKEHPEANIKVLKEQERRGKSVALNLALKCATGDIVVVSDADCFWPSDILEKALPYLADSSVGAVVGREVLLNEDESFITRTEVVYRNSVLPIRLGESKSYSTIFFEGGFSAYKRPFIDEFDTKTGSDDSGTALLVVQKGGRTILVPEAKFFTMFPKSWKGKITIKTRRAGQQVKIWIKCIRLLLNRQLLLPKRIALPQFFMYIVNPIIFAALIPVTFLLVFEFPFLLAIAIALLLFNKSRRFLVEIMQDYFVLILALIGFLSNKQFIVWRKASESRLYFGRELLEERDLV